MGVGGCGSGFIWNVLRRCGLETTEHREWMRQSGVREAIKEDTHLDFPSPKVIKHLGGFLINLNHHLETMQWEVEHIFYCVASYELQLHSYETRSKGKYNRELCIEKYERNLGKGLIQLIDADHPFSMIRCPRSITDPVYCYGELKRVLGDMPYEEFYKHHQAQISPRHLRRLNGYT